MPGPAFYRVAGRGLLVIMRDAPLLGPGLLPSPSRADLMRGINRELLEGWGLRGRRREVLGAAISHATSLTTWQSLVDQQGLREGEAVELLTALVLAAGLQHERPTAQHLPHSLGARSANRRK